MGSVTFYEDTDLTGNGSTFEIGDRTDYQILLYNDPTKPIVIRSIENTTNYFVILYYKNGDNAFGGKYINIKGNLRDINLVQHTYYTFWSQEVSPEFNGIVLNKILPDTQFLYEFNTVFSNNYFNSKPYNENVLDMTGDLNEINTKQTNTEETDSNVYPTSAETTLPTAPVEIKKNNDPYNRCLEHIKERQKTIDHFNSRIESCEGIFNSDVLPLKNEQTRLEKTVMELEQQNTELKNNGSTITVFVIIVDLLIFFYILYRHNIFRPLQHL